MPKLNIRLTGKAQLTVAALPLFFTLFTATSYAKEWRGITPAKSTRADVVRLLGKCNEAKPRCVFSSEDGDVFIVFAGAESHFHRCATQLPPDTVLLIEVIPRKRLRPSDFGLDESASKRLTSSYFPDSQVYVDAESGLMLWVLRGAVHIAYYLAAAKDRQACPSYYDGLESSQLTPSVDPVPEPPKVRASGSVGRGDDTAALDRFAADLRYWPGAHAYVIAYAGRGESAGEARARAGRAMDYLTGKHGIEEERFVIIEGGYREEPALEFFTVPAGATPPSPTPTINPKGAKTAADRKVKKP